MKRCFLLILFQVMCFISFAKDIKSTVSVKNLVQTVKVLTSDSLAGRLAGSGYDLKTARYIERELITMGYQPLIGSSGVVPFSYKEGVSYNVVMVLKSRSGEANNVLLGAHYDHLGVAEDDDIIQKINKGDLFRGANDNASGVASMLEIARLVDPNVIKHNLIIAAFGAEEGGLAGSKELVKQFKANGIDIAFMVNLEMLGTLNKEGVIDVLGRDTFDMEVMLKGLQQKKITVVTHDALKYISDHYNFCGICPVSVFATTDIVYYHHPLDDISTLNFKGMVKVTNYVLSFVNNLLFATDLPKRTIPK